jgi:hypothetical protein
MAEEQKSESHQPEMPKHSGPRRRGRRGGRGRRRPVSAAPIPDQPAQAEPPTKQIEPPVRLREEMLVRPVPSRQKFQPPVSTPRAPKREGSPLLQAADEVAEAIESLKQTLAQMEEVLELIELAERQKLTDEREIESLRRALRQLQSRRGD